MDSLDRPRRFRLEVPQFREFIYIFQKDSIFVLFIPKVPGTGRYHRCIQIPQSYSNKGCLGSVNYECGIYRVELSDGDTTSFGSCIFAMNQFFRTIPK